MHHLSKFISMWIFYIISASLLFCSQFVHALLPNLEAHNSKTAVSVSKQYIVDNDESFLGDPKAKNVIEYHGSVSCPYCISSYNLFFDRIIKDFVRTGKARYIYREMPMNNPNILLVQIAVCASKHHNSGKKYYEIIDHVMKSGGLRSFLNNSDGLGNLTKLAASYGISTDALKKCVTNTPVFIKPEVYSKVKYLPTVFVNGKLIEGGNIYDEIAKNLVE